MVACTEREQAASTQHMAELLEDIAVNVDPATHPYVNLDRVDYFRARLDHLRLSGAAINSRRREQILQARLSLANELLQAGQSDQAVQEYRQLQTVVHHPRLRHSLQMLVGLAYLRLGEQENCVVQHNINSCLMPIRGTGVHQIKRGSSAAVEEFLGILSRNPGDLSARWLLNIAYMTLGQYPEEVPQNLLIPPEVFTSDYDIGVFRDVAPQLGLDVVGLSGGTIMEDFDGDGYLDIVASSWGLRDPLRYFRNQGDGTFADSHTRGRLRGYCGWFEHLPGRLR